MKKTVQIGIHRDTITLITDVTYKNEKAWYGETERPLKLSMYLPKHKERCMKPMPLIIWLCGGAVQVVDKDIWMPQLLRFAEAGFIVASVEYRTANDMPLPYPLIDVKAAIRYLRAHHQQYCIDPQNVFIMGESAGGMLASLVGTTSLFPQFDVGDYLNQSSAVSAVVNFYGIVDLEKAYESRKYDLIHGVECLQKVSGNTLEERKQALRVFSAIQYVTSDTPPFMLLHGTADDLVDISQSEAMYEKLISNHVPCEYYRLEGCQHGVDNFYQDEVIDWILDFLRRYCK